MEVISNMAKPRIIKKNGKIYLEIISKKRQQIAEREMYLINNDEVSGLIHFSIEKKANRFSLLYDIGEFVSLSFFLKNTITKRIFAQMLINILDNLKSMRNIFIDQKMLLLDLNHVYVAENDFKIFFVCVPMHPVVQDDSLRDFLLNIVNCANFSEKEDKSYLLEYHEILNKGINFSLFELEKYVLGLIDRKEVIVCPNCQAKMEQKTSFCPSCGYEMLSNNEKVVDINNSYVKTRIFPSGTPFLVQKRTGEKIPIQKALFRIGKSTDCEFCIDNNAISRHHADIVVRENRYFIMDLNSTNMTFVNGNALLKMTETEIFPGDIIRLANEDFAFYVVK